MNWATLRESIREATKAWTESEIDGGNRVTAAEKERNAWKMRMLFGFRSDDAQRITALEFRNGRGWNKGMTPFSRRSD